MKCAICEEDNGCELNKQDHCWCEQLYIPSELLSKVPVDKREKVCICKKCVEKANNSA